MATILRWGRSAYETEQSLERERRDAETLGHDWALREDRTPPPHPETVDALVVTSKVRVDADLLSRLRGDLVITTTSGYDHVDVDAARERGIRGTRCPEARRDPVVEHALGELVVLQRCQPALQASACAGRWARGDVPALAPMALSESTVLVIGLGVIGRRMASVLDFLGARVLGVDPEGVPAGVERVALEDGLVRADAVTVHCSLTPTSRGLLDDTRLGLLAPHAVVVNTARGEVLDVEAAVRRVAGGRLRGLSVDVFPVEPYPHLAEGAGVAGVRFTPHTAGCSRDLGRRVAEGVARALGAWSRGDALPYRVA